MKAKIIAITLLLALSACAVPTKKQNPNVVKRPVKTSKFLAKNDYYAEESADKEKKVEKKPEGKKVVEKKAEPKAEPKEVAKETRPSDKIESQISNKLDKIKEEDKAEVKLAPENEKKAEVLADMEEVKEEIAVSDYPMDRHRRRAFSGFTNSTPSSEETANEVVVQEEPKEETPLYDEQGLASWYGPGFHGRKTANGESFNQNAMTAAHRKYPMGTMLEVTNLENGKSVTVRINDRGPYAGKRIIDLSKAAAKELDLLNDGVGTVGIKEMDEDE